MTHKSHITTSLFILRTCFIYVVLSAGCFFMLRTVVGYTQFRDDAQFLAYKQVYIHNPVWKTAFYIHVFSAILVLFAGFTQFSKDLLREHHVLHRFIGKLYVLIILCINVPAALVMGIYANGGLWGKAAFLILNACWFIFTAKAWTSAKAKNFIRHKDFMLRSYALTLSALTLRTWKIILLHSGLALSLSEIYILEAWLGFIPNLIVVELMIRHRRLSDKSQQG
jgi:hypothetical protein